MFPSAYVHQTCSPVLMFPSPYVPLFMILVPMFPIVPSPDITQKCFWVPLLPKLILSSPCVLQHSCFPYSPVPMFPVPMLPSPYVPQLINQSLCSPLLFHRSVFHSLYSLNMFPSAYVPQCLRSPVPMFSSPYVPQSPCSSNSNAHGTFQSSFSPIWPFILCLYFQ